MYLKEKHLCLFFLSVLVSLIIAGPLSAGVSKDDFYAVQVVEKEAWIVGSFGTILNSKDMGESWSVQESGLKESLVDVCFVDHEHGWITGPFGIILHTEDGGLSWRRQESGVNMMLFDVIFIDCQFIL